MRGTVLIPALLAALAACEGPVDVEPVDATWLLRGRAASVIEDSFKSCEIGGRVVVVAGRATDPIEVMYSSGLLSDTASHTATTNAVEFRWYLSGEAIDSIRTSAPDLRLHAGTGEYSGTLLCGHHEAGGSSWPLFGWWEVVPYPID